MLKKYQNARLIRYMENVIHVHVLIYYLIFPKNQSVSIHCSGPFISGQCLTGHSDPPCMPRQCDNNWGKDACLICSLLRKEIHCLGIFHSHNPRFCFGWYYVNFCSQIQRNTLRFTFLLLNYGSMLDVEALFTDSFLLLQMKWSVFRSLFYTYGHEDGQLNWPKQHMYG